ncbi:hypothetical protein FUSNEC_GEN_9830_07745 [Fusobacterium necrophorum subsp. funduliforme]
MSLSCFVSASLLRVTSASINFLLFSMSLSCFVSASLLRVTSASINFLLFSMSLSCFVSASLRFTSSFLMFSLFLSAKSSTLLKSLSTYSSQCSKVSILFELLFTLLFVLFIALATLLGRAYEFLLSLHFPLPFRSFAFKSSFNGFANPNSPVIVNNPNTTPTKNILFLTILYYHPPSFLYTFV